MIPPEIDPVAFLTKRIEWRYKHGTPALTGAVRLGDSVQVLKCHRSCEIPYFAIV